MNTEQKNDEIIRTDFHELNKENIYKNILQDLDVGIYFTDVERTIAFWNKGAEKISGFSKEEITGRACFANILNHVDETGKNLCVQGCPLNIALKGVVIEDIIYLHHKEGYRVKVKAKVSPIYDNGKIVGAVEVFEKVGGGEEFYANDTLDEKDYSVKDLKILAMYDQLTALPNRRYLENFLKTRLMEYELLQIKFGILYMDIDNFSHLNNTYGHDLGDRILQMVAKTFVNVTRKTDLIGRWGGEEFVAIFSMISRIELEIIAEKIRVLIESSILRETGGNEHHVTISIGGTFVKEGDDINSIIKRADLMMYESKQKGKNQVTFG